MKLPLRLQTVADMIRRGTSMADIGSDHALLCIYLAENGLVSRAIASEIADKPYQRALAAVNGSQKRDLITVRQGNGLFTLEPGEVFNVVIAGMGGDTIVAILAQDLVKSVSFPRYIFQPMSKWQVLRSFLAAQGWPVEEEKLVKENGHFFVVMAASPGHTPYHLSRLEAEIGPSILRADTELKRDFMQKYRNKYLKTYHSLIMSRQEENVQAAGEYRKMVERLEEILDAGDS
ncbi:MAG: tRNA (adenine(22)-N(1))-methyltransferase [Syntrophomonadaceae bacterium]|jgi:tRNA (adenine22-N1)-methyltransferase